ncbi:MAG: hypothetical protein JWM57_224, partial [Phycisphaerales bacterium]|nr:hypothetical protein [Phycisphaerales bacterium]
MTFEPLEARRLLAGITLITHGLNGDVTGWVARVAEGVEDRAGGSSAASIYTMTVAAASNGKLGVTAFGPDSGQKDYRSTTAGELIIKLDWNTVSGGSYTTGQVADVVSAYVLATPRRGSPLAELPVHLIGHSRGASLVTALSQNLGKAGVWVDQVTSLDPHPVDGVNDIFGANFGDAKMTTFDNVAFADDYWRTDGNVNNFDYDGEPVNGAHQGNLNNIVQTNFIASAHLAVTAYYVGTVNLKTSDGGEHPVLSSWYGSTSAKPARDATGYVYSRLGGGARPADGLSTLLGGSGKRDSAGESGSQWANVFNFSYAGSNSVSGGTSVATRFVVADRDSKVRVDVFADTDANPYNGGLTAVGARNFASTDALSGRITATTAGLAAGTYRLAARATDSDGHTRWYYGTRALRVTAPNFASVSGGVLTVSGTAANDVISLSQSSSTITATLNGSTQTFAANTVSSIAIQGNTGNDGIDASAMTTAMYINGGPGFDNIIGGAGNDTLSGGAQSDT